MNKVLLFLVLFGVTFVALAQKSKKQPIAQPDNVDVVYLQKTFGNLIGKTPQCEIELEAETYLGMLRTFATSIDKGMFAEKPIRSQTIMAFLNTIAAWPKIYKYFELDTDISIKSLSKMYKLLQTVYKANIAMDIAEKRRDRAVFEKYKKVFNDSLDVFTKEIDKIEKPLPAKREQLRTQKLKEHRAYLEYLRQLKKQRGEEE